MVRAPLNWVLFDPVRSAEPPRTSGSAGPRMLSTACEDWRVACGAACLSIVSSVCAVLCCQVRASARPSAAHVAGGHRWPAVADKALRGFVREPLAPLAVDRNAVALVENNELSQPQRARQRARLVGHPFHQAAVTAEGVGVVIDD